MKQIWKEATIFLFTIILVTSSSAMAGVNNLETKKSSNTNSGSKGDYIVWDNNMDYDNLVAAIEPQTPVNIDVYPADDFQFETLTYVTGVRWIGGYIDYNPETWNWCIDIYFDDGTGDFPGDEKRRNSRKCLGDGS
jgi:hypothetical protein